MYQKLYYDNHNTAICCSITAVQMFILHGLQPSFILEVQLVWNPTRAGVLNKCTMLKTCAFIEFFKLRNAHIRSTYFDTVFSHFIFCSAFTAEQYQHHQQQLALMQKQQLAQIHQQQANSNSSTNASQVRELPVLWFIPHFFHQESSLILHCCHNILQLTNRKMAFAWIFILALR